MVGTYNEYRRLVELSFDGIVIHVENKIVFINPIGAKLLGADTPEQLIGRSILDFVHADYRGIVEKRVQKVREKGEGAPLIEEKFIRLDGEEIDVEVTGALATHEGKPAVQVVFRDITERKRTEEALRIKDNAIASSVGAIAIAEFAGNLTYVNRSFLRMWGYDGESEVLGKPATQFWRMEEEARDVIEALRDEGRWAGELVAKKKDGASFNVHLSANVVVDESGEPICMMASFVDISERVRSEEERAQAEEAMRRRALELEALQATVLDIIAPHDLPTLLRTIVVRAVLLLNAPSGGMYLCEPEQNQVRCVVSYNTPRDYTGTVLKYGEGAAGTVAQTGESLIIDDYRAWSDRAAVYEKDQPFTAVLTVPMIWQGEVIGTIHVLDDVESRHFTQAELELLTLFASHAAIAIENAQLYQEAQSEIAERERAEEALRDSRNMLQAVLDSIPSAVFWKDRDSIYLGGNRTWLEAIGLQSSDEVVGKSDYDLTWEKEQADSYRKDDRRVMESGIPEYGIIEPYRRADGTHAWARTNKVPLRDTEGKVTGVLGTYEDITERVRSEEERARAEEALQESEGRYHALSELTSDYATAIRVEPDGALVVEWATEAFTRITGFVPTKMSFPDDLSKLVHPDDLAAMYDRMKAGLSGEPQEAEYRITAKTGDVRWIHAYTQPVWSEAQNRVVHFYIAAQDITERVRSEEERARAEDLMHAQRDLGLALSAAPGLGEMLRLCTEAAIRVSGMDCGGVYLVDEHTGDLDLAFHTGLSPGFVKSASHYDSDSVNARLVMAGEPVYGKHQELGVRLDRAHRREGLRAIAVLPVRYEGQIIACLNVASHTLEDVPDFAGAGLEAVASQIGSAIAHAKTVSALRENEERYRSLAETSPDAITITDLSGKLVWANQRNVELHGCERVEELLGLNAFELVAPEDRRRAVENARKTLETGSVRNVEYTMLRRDGTRFAAELSASVIVDAKGEPTAFVGVVRDVTERVRSEEERARAEEVLRQSEERYRSFVQSFQGIAFRGRMDFTPIFFHGAVEEITGYAEREFLDGKPRWNQVIHPEDLPALLAEDGGRLRSTPHYSYEREYRIVRKDGAVRWVHEIIQNVCDDSGEPAMVQGVIYDITERVRSEEERTRAAERLRLLSSAVEQTTEGVAVSDLEGNLLFVNNAFASLHGYTSKELVGEHLSIFHTAEQLPSVEAANHQVQETGEFNGEIWHVRRDGAVFLTVMHNSLLRDESGNAIGMVGTLRDITERKRLEHEIEERRVYLESVLASAPDAIVTLTAQNRVLEWNPGAERLFGHAREEAVGQDIDDLITGSDPAIYEEATGLTGRAVVGESVASIETIRYRQDGSPVDVILSGSPIWIEDEIIGIVAVYVDISERKQAEEAMRRQGQLAAVGQLAGGIAHDFNNLLTTIMLYAQMPLGKPDLPSHAARALETILGESRHAAQLVQQILDFSRRSTIKTRPVDLRPFVEDSVRVLQRTVSENISLLLKAEPGEYVVNVDPTRIQQVLMNLVVNARDAMPEGGVLRIDLSRVETSADQEPPVAGMAAGEWACLTVSDTGTGILPEVLPHIYEPFFSTKPPGAGVGLGLAQVYGIVSQHDGYIGLESEVGKGTTFRVYLPICQSNGETKEPQEEAVLPTPMGQGETILLVEDNKRIRKAGQEILESLGYRVLVAENGREALEVYRSADRVDLVLTDVVMPEMGGKELVRELTKINPRLRTLATTGHLLEDDLQALREEGILDVVYKPFDVGVLARMIRDVLDKVGEC